MKDWNSLTLDQMVEYLREEYKFSSSGDAKCIYHLIEFYDNKNKASDDTIPSGLCWSEPTPPIIGISRYDHVTCLTPLGVAIIEWKSWKQSDSYSLTIVNEYIGEGFDLDGAKQLAVEWLSNKHKELSLVLGI